MLQEQSH